MMDTFTDQVRMIADELDERVEGLRRDFRDDPRSEVVRDIFEVARVRAVNAAERKEPPQSDASAQTVVSEYASRLYDDVLLHPKPWGCTGEIEDVHRALLCVGFKPDHKIVLRMQEAYRHARRSLDT